MRGAFLVVAVVCGEQVASRRLEGPGLSGHPCVDASGVAGPCAPGRESCGAPFERAPRYHLMDQHGCGENDPNGPVFDPVHGVFHHFVQDHISLGEGRGPIYGHFVSRDLAHWAQVPAALWNGVDVATGKSTLYDTVAIYTGSAVVVEGAGPPDGATGRRGRGVVQIYPGLCTIKDYGPACTTGTVLAQAVPAAYADDALLVNWTKPGYNPIVQGTARDPTTPWKDPATGEWRLRTFDSKVYGAASDAALLRGEWYLIGRLDDFLPCECPSLYPLPRLTPGFSSALKLPTHVHKVSCGGRDVWQLGDYVSGPVRTTGTFKPAVGWEDAFAPTPMDAGDLYASKDALYPPEPRTSRSKQPNEARRISWGWAQVPPNSAQTLPRVVTFNPEARTLEQAPIAEVEALREVSSSLGSNESSDLTTKVLVHRDAALRQSELLIELAIPTTRTLITVQAAAINCTLDYAPPPASSASYSEVPVACGGRNATLRLLPRERTLALRIFFDWTFIEAFFQNGRTVITRADDVPSNPTVAIHATQPVTLLNWALYPLEDIWVTPDDVRHARRIYFDDDGADDP